MSVELLNTLVITVNMLCTIFNLKKDLLINYELILF
jgi:hypothetical protein